MNFLAFDFETANSARNSACAIGYALVENGEIIENESYLIRPPNNRYDHRNIVIHGIRPETLAHRPYFPEIWNILKPKFLTEYICAHYAAFDAYVLIETLQHYQIELIKTPYFCVQQISKGTWPQLQNYKLPTIAKHLNLDLKHHNPQSDALVTAQIVLAAQKELQTTDIKQLLKKAGTYKKHLTPSKSKKPKTQPINIEQEIVIKIKPPKSMPPVRKTKTNTYWKPILITLTIIIAILFCISTLN